MLRRGFLKLLGAAIAVPVIGWPVRWLSRLSGWNVWVGGDTESFDNPRCWSHGRIPDYCDSVIAPVGRNVSVYHHWPWSSLNISKAKAFLDGSGYYDTAITGCTIGQQGRRCE